MSGGDNYRMVIRDDLKKGVRRNIGLGLTARSSNANMEIRFSSQSKKQWESYCFLVGKYFTNSKSGLLMNESWNQFNGSRFHRKLIGILRFKMFNLK